MWSYNIEYFICWNGDVKSSKLWASQLWKQFMQLPIWKPAKTQDFNRVWTYDLATMVRWSNQLSYGATDVWSWSFVGRKEAMRSKCEVIIWNISYIELRMWNQVSYEPRWYESNLCNLLQLWMQSMQLSIWKPEIVRTSTGFEPVILVRHSNQLRYEGMDVGSWK